MPKTVSGFSPGFRFSVTDALVLAAAAGLMYWIWHQSQPIALLAGFVVGHFFLFCNVFRISQNAELSWAGTFVALVALSLFTSLLDLPVAAGLCVLLSTFLIIREMRLPHYHGIFWKQVNPRLHEWWEINKKSRP